MSTNLDKAVFIASIPPIQTGIKAGGDGMRVQFDIPASEDAEAAKLFLMKRKPLLKVTVEVWQDRESEAADAINMEDAPMGEPESFKDLY